MTKDEYCFKCIQQKIKYIKDDNIKTKSYKFHYCSDPKKVLDYYIGRIVRGEDWTILISTEDGVNSFFQAICKERYSEEEFYNYNINGKEGASKAHNDYQTHSWI